MIHYPLLFSVEVRHARGMGHTWSSIASVPSPEGELPCAIPPEFEGPGGGFSPEDFFALAVANCFTATFQVIADKSKVEFKEVNIASTLMVDRDSQGRPWMKHVLMTVTVDAGATDHSRLRRVLEKTSQSCIVIHSIKTEVQFEFVIR